MARAYQPVEAVLKGVLADAVNPALKAAKFKKTALNHHRRHGETVQVVNVQISHGSTGMEKRFYVNVGVAFDALCKLIGVPVLEKPKEYQCEECGIQARLEGLLPGAPSFWTVGVGQDTAAMVTALGGFIEFLVVELDRIDGLAAYRSHRWFDRYRPQRVNAKVLYALGDMEGARREVRHLAEFFADRNGNSTDWWVEHLHLTGLIV